MVEIDIVYEKTFGALRLPRLYTPQGAEKGILLAQWPAVDFTKLFPT